MRLGTNQGRPELGQGRGPTSPHSRPAHPGCGGQRHLGGRQDHHAVCPRKAWQPQPLDSLSRRRRAYGCAPLVTQSVHDGVRPLQWSNMVASGRLRRACSVPTRQEPRLMWARAFGAGIVEGHEGNLGVRVFDSVELYMGSLEGTLWRGHQHSQHGCCRLRVANFLFFCTPITFLLRTALMVF